MVVFYRKEEIMFKVDFEFRKGILFVRLKGCLTKETYLKKILNQEKALKMIDGFKQNKKCEKMCQHCNFYDRIKN